MNESKDVPANPEENETPDSNKKQKKEKKKRWSFRSFSFSKKDKQKPVKKEEATNGECEKVPEEVSSKTKLPLFIKTVLPIKSDEVNVFTLGISNFIQNIFAES